MQKPSLNLGLEAALAVVILGLAGCSADSNASRGDGTAHPRLAGAGNSPGAPGSDSFGNPIAPTGGQRSPIPTTNQPSGPCVNLQCKQHYTCSGGGTTTISGMVFDPGGVHPLYNVAVYVPNEPLAALPTGASCDSCDSLYSGTPVAAALTDATGHFTIPKVPEGDNIPLVVQVGKWRRQFTIPTVTKCQDNPMPDGMLRLPRNRMEGDIPKIAISTGMADTLECLLRRVGIDASEYVPGGMGDGRIHIFQGASLVDPNILAFLGVNGLSASPNTSPPARLSSEALWNSVDNLMPYDIVLLSCEGQETIGMNQQALLDYANAGGRVFASHFHYAWFNTGPFANANVANWMPGANDVGNIMGTIVTTLPNGQPFPKGQAMAQWLENVGALQNGQLSIAMARHNADVTPTHTPSQPWIVAAQGSQANGATQYFSFDTPIAAANAPDAQFCGRVVFSDLHVGAVSGDNPVMPVPTGCGTGMLSPQEAALEFMLFDLSSCITPNEVPPQPPPVE